MFARRMVLRTLLFLLALTPPLVPAAPTAAAPVLPITEFTLLLGPTDGPKQPQCIVAGPDGNLWITENQSNSIARMTPAGVVTEYPIPVTMNALPEQIAPGPDGNLWFAMYGGGATGPGRLGHVNPTTGVVTEVPLTTPGHTDARTWSVVNGPDNNIWFTEYDKHAIGRMKPDGTGQTAFVLPAPYDTYATPTDITVGPDGAIWFTNWGGDAIGRIPVTATVSSDIKMKDLPSGAAPIGLISGPDGNLWFGETGLAQVGRINPATMTLLAPIPLPGSTAGTAKTGPLELAVGPDKLVYVVEYVPNLIARVTMTGQVTEFPVPSKPATAGTGNPNTITQGPGGKMYFTEEATDKVGVFSVQQKLYLPVLSRS